MGYAQKPAKRGINVTGEQADVEAELKDVLARTKAEEGAKYRANVQKLSQAMRAEKAGSATQVTKEFASD